MNLKRAEKARILVNKIPGICRIRETQMAQSTSFSSLFELFYVDVLESASRDLIGFVGHVALVDTLVAKTRAWEEDRGIQFAYDGVPLLAMLDEYAMLRQEREEEKQRMRVSSNLVIITCSSTCMHAFKPHCSCFILA